LHHHKTYLKAQQIVVTLTVWEIWNFVQCSKIYWKYTLPIHIIYMLLPYNKVFCEKLNIAYLPEQQFWYESVFYCNLQKTELCTGFSCCHFTMMYATYNFSKNISHTGSILYCPITLRRVHLWKNGLSWDALKWSWNRNSMLLVFFKVCLWFL
jgi:hypothetical protein